MKKGGGAGGAGGDLGSIQDMMAKAFENPEMMNALNAMGENVQKAMEEMAKMSPEQIQEQMQQAMQMMTSGDIMDSVVGKKDEVLANLKQTGLVSDEELAKYEADPEYFEQQMKGAFSQMEGLFSDPDIIKTATETMQGMQQAMSNPIVTEMQQLLLAEDASDLKIEELRLKVLQDKESLTENALIGNMFSDADFAASLSSEAAFKVEFLKAREALQSVMGGGGIPGFGGAAAADIGAAGDIGIGAL